MGFSQLHNRYLNEFQIQSEMRNIFSGTQPRQFKTISSTPSLLSLQDNEVVIFSSGAVKIMWRNKQEIFAIAGSCVTVVR